MKDWLEHQRRRFVCFVKDHEPAAVVNWHPETVCLHIMCSRCGKGIGHLRLPTGGKRNTEKLH